ncbi:MAG: Dabb family protein [Planctomycetes bacterium]|nr:Dabb family protein [Planctomycetota bacterium]MCH9727618.1 Dabb family protein [Planctomycetota bacterium]MCH9777402.1 Dabb family protein [Planctomycetota bacterium]MCH9791262.1 Dabb family protein [Planctomycetota bacterium]MDF1742741.1 Dabb family protein [Gimesia sp.]
MAETQLAHMVYFTLNDDSPQAIEAMVQACHKYLKNHPGVLHFSAGTRGKEFQRDVNDQEYHVALNVIFDNKDSHDIYQTSADHLTYIAENKAKWAKVRVFDSYVTS